MRFDGIRATPWLLLASTTFALAACDDLGNPPQIQRTPTTTTASAAVRLVTRTETVAAARAGALLGRIVGRPHRVEPAGPAFVTLVIVDVDPPGAILPRRVALDTVLETDAGLEHHRWAAPGTARPFVALLATRSPPRAARTRPTP